MAGTGLILEIGGRWEVGSGLSKMTGGGRVATKTGWRWEVGSHVIHPSLLYY